MKFMNASGCHCTTKQELIELYNCSACNMIVSKSSTIFPREGNPTPRYYETDTLSINSTGLRNKGIYYYLDMVEYFNGLNKEVDILKQKRYIISFAELDKIKLFINIISNHYNIHKIPMYFELNLSCPNIPGKGQLGYDFAESYKFLDLVFSKIDINLITNKKINFGVKLPPYFDTIHFQKMADVLNQFPLTHITCINSLGNGFVFNNKCETSIAGNNGYGGIGGSVIKPFGLSNVRKFRELIHNKIEIYGCGGISYGCDVYEYEKCGASVVQIGTELVSQGPNIFNYIKNEYKIIINYINILKTTEDELMNENTCSNIKNIIKKYRNKSIDCDDIDIINSMKNDLNISINSQKNKTM